MEKDFKETKGKIGGHGYVYRTHDRWFCPQNPLVMTHSHPLCFYQSPITCQEFLSHWCLLLFNRNMNLLQNPRGLHCHSSSGTCHLCVLQISLWDLSGCTWSKGRSYFYSSINLLQNFLFYRFPLKLSAFLSFGA